MSTAVANRWREAIERRLDVLGITIGQAGERLLSAGGDTSWFRLFMNRTTDRIDRRDKEDIVLALEPNFRIARGQSHTREILATFSEEQLLNTLLIDCKLPEY